MTGYKPRTLEQVQRRKLSGALHCAELGDMAPLRAYLRRWLPAADDADAIIEAIQQNRATVATVPEETATMERVIERRVRARERAIKAANGGRLQRGERPKLLDDEITRRWERGELDGPGEIKPVPPGERRRDWKGNYVRDRNGKYIYLAEQKLVFKMLPINRQRILDRLNQSKNKQRKTMRPPRRPVSL
ncbi:MAG: hypothetical protein ACLPTZ_15085 [Beijerinckiaceae bacterium]